MTAASPAAEASFTHFRSARPAPPLAGLGVVGMLLGFACVVISIGLAYAVNVIAGLVFALFSAVALMSIAVRDRHGSSWVERTGIRVAHLYATRTGATLHQGGPVSRLGTYRLPGVLADTDLTEHEDAQGNPFGLVHTPRSNHYAVTIEAHPDGASLIDADDQVANIDRWGRWLDFLAVEPGILQVQVTIETAPDDGHGLRSEIESTMSADAPDLARKVLGEITDSYPTGSATVRWLRVPLRNSVTWVVPVSVTTQEIIKCSFQAFGPSMRMAMLSKTCVTVNAPRRSAEAAVVGVPKLPSRSSVAPAK